MVEIVETVNRWVWGIPALILLSFTGLIFSVRTSWAQIRYLPCAIQAFLAPFYKLKSKSDTSRFQAVCTALAATVGTGNLVGVAGAISIGGPGAIFWMWVCAFLGMAIKYAEATLAVRYSNVDGKGMRFGGPMYIIRQAMSKRWHILAYIYCFFGVIASFGVGAATQVNAVITGVNSAIANFGVKESSGVALALGVLLASLSLVVLCKGAKRIFRVSTVLVPFAAFGYILLCTGALIARFQYIPTALMRIIHGAFSPTAVTGGIVGSIFQTMRIGVSRGVFTNEAGMGTASIAHAAANVEHPSQQGLMGIVEVFLDTIVICTLTALVILCSQTPIVYGKDLGAVLTVNAFCYVYGQWVKVLLACFMCCFAVATIFGWGLYGARCAQFLFGESSWKYFAWLQALSIVLGSILKTEVVWEFSEIANGLMAIPNLLMLLYLCPEVVNLTNSFKQLIDRKVVKGGTYENFNQCKPM